MIAKQVASKRFLVNFAKLATFKTKQLCIKKTGIVNIYNNDVLFQILEMK
jgi:hypothetical protein